MLYPRHSLVGVFTPLQRCSGCILQPQPTGLTYSVYQGSVSFRTIFTTTRAECRYALYIYIYALYIYIYICLIYIYMPYIYIYMPYIYIYALYIYIYIYIYTISKLIYIYIYIYSYICTYMSEYVCICLYVCVCVFICMCVNISVYK